MFDKNIYIQRRKLLKNYLKTGIILLPGNSNSPMCCQDNCYPFIQDSIFSYFFGINEPNFVGVIDVDNDKDYIFAKDFTLDDIIWMGPQKLFKDLVEEVGVYNFIDIDNLKNFLTNINKKIHYVNPYRDDIKLLLANILSINPFDIAKFSSLELTKSIIKLRSIKSKEEISEIEKAVNITRKMHLEAMTVAKAGMKEYEVTAAVEAICKKYNAYPSFHTICTINGEILHNHSQNNILKNGDLLLLDCGAKSESGYCGDMTSVFPISGTFTKEQTTFYNILIKMFETAEKEIKPYITYKEVHLKVSKILLEELKKLNLVKGEINDLIENGIYGLFMPHGLGHMLGLDVHDMENLGEDLVGYDETCQRSNLMGLKSLRLAKKLEPGFVFTIEPGIYFIPELIKKWKSENKFIEYLNYNEIEKLSGKIGMRYEGNYVITENGSKRLGEPMPRTINEIETLLK